MVAIRSLTANDLAAGLRLKAEAGWNQVEADWRRFLDLGDDGGFVAVREGRVVGTVTTCRFGSVGWVAMLLVEAAHRGIGIGKGLLIRSLEHLEAQGARTIRLDATPQGRPLYESLGFRVDFPLQRFGGIIDDAPRLGSIRPGRSADLAAVAALDRSATGTDRLTLIDRLIGDNPDAALVSGTVGGPLLGFVLWRPGSSADQVGPCIAGPDAGRPLLDAACQRLVGRPLIVDIPSDHGAAVAWALDRGLSPRRSFARMTRGVAVVEDLDRLWASSGPEMG